MAATPDPDPTLPVLLPVENGVPPEYVSEPVAVPPQGATDSPAPHPLDDILGPGTTGQTTGQPVQNSGQSAPAEPQVEDISETLRKLIAQSQDHTIVNLGNGVAQQRDTVPNAMITDSWTQMMAKSLTGQEWNVNDDGFTHKSTQVEVTDAMTAAFDYFPATDPDCASIMRRRWYDSLLASKAFKELHITTAGNDELAGMAAATFANEYHEYCVQMTAAQAQAATSPVDTLTNEMHRHGSASGASQLAADQIQEAQDLCHAFGDSACKTLKKLFTLAKNNSHLRRIAELAGKYRRLAQSLQQSKPVEGTDDVVGVTLGSDVSRLTVGELGNLSFPALRLDTLRRVVEGEAHVREYQSVAQENRGPIMLLVDESGSMDGEPIQNAKAMAMAIVWLAGHQNRWCCLVGWSSRGQVRTVTLPPGEDHQDAVIDWCSQMFSGGTDPPVSIIPQLFQDVGAPEGKTDVIWLTDGHCSIPSNEVEAFNEFRRDHSVRSFCLGIGCHPGGFEEICDEIHTVDNLSVDSQEVESILSI
jgi:uncharacterized protein with von Willebrand factor type A (vWA) domain